MKLANGNFYKTGDGKVVRVQMEKAGELVAYDASGSKVHTCKADDHVNGWEPCGAADYKAARKVAKGSAKRPTKKKESKSTDKE